MATNQYELRSTSVASRRDAFKLAGVVAAGGAAVAMTTGLPATPAQAGPAQTGPVVANRFSVEIDGVLVAGIHSVEGIESESDVVEFKNGTDNTVHLIPGNRKPGKITITKDWSNTHEFYNWRKLVLDGAAKFRKSISVIFQSDSGEESRMNFFECWPSRWKGPALNARNSAHATESLEIVWERIELK